MLTHSGSTNVAEAPVMLMYTMVNIGLQKSIFEMGRQDLEVGFQLFFLAWDGFFFSFW